MQLVWQQRSAFCVWRKIAHDADFDRPQHMLMLATIHGGIVLVGRDAMGRWPRDHQLKFRIRTETCRRDVSKC